MRVLMTPRARSVLIALGVVLFVLAGALWIAAARVGRWARPLVISSLERALDAEVTLDDFEIGLFPTPAATGRGLTIRHHGRHDVPPLISVQRFSARSSWEAARRRHVQAVWLDGLAVAIPPDRRGMFGWSSKQGKGGPPRVTIDHVTTSNATLTLIPRDPQKDPRVFDVYTLVVDGLTGDVAGDFRASLHNPLPAGQIDASGTFGPWNGGSPMATPLTGSFVYDADLSSIKGIAGRLHSTGDFDGSIGDAHVVGDGTVPDFRIPRLKASALPLQFTFDARVDNTNKGDVALTRMDAVLGRSRFISSGTIIGTKGLKGKRVTIRTSSSDARLEDILRFVTPARVAPMTGTARIAAEMDLPQRTDTRDALDRLVFTGTATLQSVRFTHDRIQEQVDDLSRKGQGRPGDLTIDNVASQMRVAYDLRNARVRLSRIDYQVPGASIHLAGTYDLASRAIDIDGLAKLKATVSQTQRGVKRVLLRPFDRLLRKDGAGTRLRLNLNGTMDRPSFKVDIWKSVRGK